MASFSGFSLAGSSRRTSTAASSSADAANGLEKVIGHLIERGVVDARDVTRARRVSEESCERLDAVLCRLGLASESDLADAIASALGLERVTADGFPSQPAFLEALGRRFLSNARLLPLDETEDVLELRLAVGDVFDASAVDSVRLKLGVPVRVLVATPSDIEAALAQLRESDEDAPGALDVADVDTAADVARLRDLASEAPVVRIVNQLIRQAVETRASDIHIEPLDQGVQVRLRVDGLLRNVSAPPSSLRAAIISRIKIMARLDIAEQRLPQDGRIQTVVVGRRIDLRVATSPTLNGESVVLRLLDRSGLTLTFDGLGFDGVAKSAISPLIDRPHGVVLVTGPTGSGKTSTLYAAISQLNSAERKIVTIEDPVEYQLPGVSQIQVKSQIGLTFAAGLRSILRQDPDIVMIGEIRDGETAEIAVQAALTGHLVLATLHTNSAAATINRLRDMGVEDYLITATLAGVVAQRLVRRLCQSCAAPSDGVLAAAVASFANPLGCREPVGCPDCRDTGYSGRTAIVEVLTMDDALRRATLERCDQSQLDAVAREAGMRSLREHGLERVAAGQTSISEVLRVAAET